MWRRRKLLLTALAAMAVLIALAVMGEKEDAQSVTGREDREKEAVYARMLRMDGFERLNAAGLRALLDHTLYEKDGDWIIYYGPNGEGRMRFLRMTFADGTRTDTGRRTITADGRYCTQWEKQRGGARRCGRLWRKGNLYYGMLIDGFIGSRYTVRPGNVEGL